MRTTMSSTTKTALNYPKFVVNYRSQQRCSTIETAGRDVTNSKLPTVTIKLNRPVVCRLSDNQTHNVTM